MGILDALRPAPHEHPRLGRLQYARGRWHGVVTLRQDAEVPLHLPGSRGGPAADALTLAERIPVLWQAVEPVIARELYEHYTNGRDAGLDAIPELVDASAVWRYVTVSSVDVAQGRSEWDFEVALRTAWDDEHTLGARVRHGQLLELNGSILEAR